MPNVGFVRRELKDMLSSYQLVRDCVNGEQAIKRRRQRYLPWPNTGEDPTRAMARYEAYLVRAIFYNVARHTLGGMVGNVFNRAPQIEVPDQLKPVLVDATGVGISATQLAKQGLSDTMGVGRAGLFVDYPHTDGPLSAAQVAVGNVRPWIEYIKAEQIINWRTEKVGGVNRVTLVVWEEEYNARDDGFEITKGTRYRVLRLQDGRYINQIWDKNRNAARLTVEPTGPDGKPFNTLPFMFVGAENNSPDIGPAPLYDLCALNIGHYRNSADYEESAFMVGQPTPWISGVTEQWVKNVWATKQITLGSRSAIVLPAGGAAGLIQASPNTMPKEAMDMKQAQMVAIGAKLVQDKKVQRTATEANQDEAATQSTLSSGADNVGYAFEWALSWCAAYLGISEAGIKFKLNSEFDLVRMTANERQALIQEWQANAITFGELRSNLRRGGVATETDEDALKLIEEWKKAHPALLPAPNPNPNPGAKPAPANPAPAAN